MFYRGVVENNDDPKQLGRVQVRVFGIHDSGSNVSPSALPWAEVSGGTDFGLYQGVGVTSILRKGTLVWLFFHNEDYNYPIIFAVIKGKGDINDVAKGSYADIATIKTASGNIIEIGDGAGAEKIEIKHMSGTKIVLEPDGSILIESTNNIVQKATSDDTNQVGGNKKITASNIFLN